MSRGDATFQRGALIRQGAAKLADVTLAAVFAAAGVFHPRPKLRTLARIVILGGGTAGITVAARLCHALDRPDITVVEPSSRHVYQPGQTLVGAGVFPKAAIIRAEHKYIP